eukprot:2763604-Pyramimonas_sp.AAC.1
MMSVLRSRPGRLRGGHAPRTPPTTGRPVTAPQLAGQLAVRAPVGGRQREPVGQRAGAVRRGDHLVQVPYRSRKHDAVQQAYGHHLAGRETQEAWEYSHDRPISLYNEHLLDDVVEEGVPLHTPFCPFSTMASTLGTNRTQEGWVYSRDRPIRLCIMSTSSTMLSKRVSHCTPFCPFPTTASTLGTNRTQKAW